LYLHNAASSAIALDLQKAKNCSSGSPSNMAGRTQKMLAPNSPWARACSNSTDAGAEQCSGRKSSRITKITSTSFGALTSET